MQQQIRLFLPAAHKAIQPSATGGDGRHLQTARSVPPFAGAIEFRPCPAERAWTAVECVGRSSIAGMLWRGATRTIELGAGAVFGVDRLGQQKRVFLTRYGIAAPQKPTTRFEAVCPRSLRAHREAGSDGQNSDRIAVGFRDIAFVANDERFAISHCNQPCPECRKCERLYGRLCGICRLGGRLTGVSHLGGGMA